MISLLILVLVAAVAYWIVGMLPLPQPFKNIVLVILGLIFLVYLLGYLGVVVPMPLRR